MSDEYESYLPRPKAARDADEIADLRALLARVTAERDAYLGLLVRKQDGYAAAWLGWDTTDERSGLAMAFTSITEAIAAVRAAAGLDEQTSPPPPYPADPEAPKDRVIEVKGRLCRMTFGTPPHTADPEDPDDE